MPTDDLMPCHMPAAVAIASSPRLTRPHLLLLLLFAASLLLIGLGRRALTWHEVVAAYPAKEMLRHGHWTVPMFVGVPRTAKPPGTTWLIAGALALFPTDAEWVPRLPAALAGILTCILTARFTARHFGSRIGLLAGVIQASCVYTLMQARLAEADMLLCAAVAAAMFAFASAVLPPNHQSLRSRWVLPILFHSAIAVAFLLKGPIGPLFIFLSALAFALVRRERHIFRFLFHPLGLAILLAGLIAWPLAAYRAHPPILDAWIAELSPAARIQRHGGESSPIFLYFYETPILLLPWLPLIAIGLWQGLQRGLQRSWHRRPLGQFLLCWFLPGFILLTLMPFRHKHYIIPLLPPFSLAGAWALNQLLPTANRRATATLITVLLITWLLEAFVVAWIIPRQEGYRFAAELAQRAPSHIPPDQTIWLIDTTPGKEPYAAWYLRPPVGRCQRLHDLHANPPATRQIHILAKREHLDALRKLGDVEVLDQARELRRREKESERLVLFRITRT